MPPEGVVSAIVVGSVLIALGLVPGLFHGLEDGIRNFADTLRSPFPISRTNHTEYDKLPRPLWLSALGTALIALSLLAYWSS